MTSSSTRTTTTTIETQRKQRRQQVIQSIKYNNMIDTTITMENNSSDNSNSSNSSISIKPTDSRRKKQVSFENLENISLIEYEQSDNNIDELWYTNSELQKCRNDYIINIKSHHRYKKRQDMKNRVEIAWRILTTTTRTSKKYKQ